MKKLLLALALLCTPSLAMAQCNGVFPNNTVCGNITGGANTPRPTNPSAFLGAAGGTNGQIQYNNSGALGGFTASGDATINTATGAVTVAKINGNSVPSGVADSQVQIGNGANSFIFSTVPNCATGVLQYTAATHVFSCGSSGTSLPRGYISGCTHSNDVSNPNTVIDIAVCIARDSTNAQTISVASAFTKSTAIWAVGTGNGCLDTGTVAVNTWYYMYAILRTDLSSADYACSVSPSAPNLSGAGLTNYSFFRLAGMFKTAIGTTNILAFKQLGEKWFFAAPIREGGSPINCTIASSLTPALTVPKIEGVSVIFNNFMFSTTAAASGMVFGPGSAPVVSTNTSTGDGYSLLQNVVNVGAGGLLTVPVDSSGRISFACDHNNSGGSDQFNIYTKGWIFTP